jgi:hypothetical protein
MNAEQLLVFMSEVGGGPWTAFDKACQAIGASRESGDGVDAPSAYQMSENLSALGHAEFSPAPEPLWSISPATLVQVVSRGANLEGVLAGARLHALVQRLDEIGFSRAGQPNGPNRVSISRPSLADLEHVADDLEIEFGQAFSDALADLLPNSDERLDQAEVRRAPEGWDMWRFNEDWLRWEEVSGDRRDGFYRYRRFTTEYRYRDRGDARVMDRSAGIFEALRRAGRAVLEYEPRTKTLSVPAIVGLPPLSARTAVLCSGFLPVVDRFGGRIILRFGDVPVSVADRISASLS